MNTLKFHPHSARQHGGFAVGLIVGLLIGLLLALGVALYVTKAPMPFVNKVPQRTAVQDAAEAEKNKNWDPNSALYGKNPAKTSNAPKASQNMGMPSVVNAPPDGGVEVSPPKVTNVVPKTSARAASARIERGERSDDTAAVTPTTPTTPSTPDSPSKKPQLGGVRPSTDVFTYFVQAGAYSQNDEAEQQRAKLAMMGLEARLTEREQSGRTVYRVRLGPFETKLEADTAKEVLSGAGIEANLVRVQR
jgi:cell division protein FtsN